MFRRLSSGVAVLALALPASFAATAAAAEPGPPPGGAILLHGSHGYKLFALFGSKDGKGAMQLFVGRRGEEATYEASGEVSAGGIDVDLGPLGKFEAELRATGRTETVKACGKPTKVPGYEYVGTIEFHGEEGFTEAVATHAQVQWGVLLSIVCGTSFSGEDFGPATPGVRIKVRRKRGPQLQLNQNHRGAKVVYSAGIDEREGAVSVSRLVTGRLGAGALSFTPSLGAATFTGAGPFEGKASYVEARPPRGSHPGQGAWRGDLKVDFPGAAGVRLAGPGFKAGIVHAHRDEFHE